MTNNSTDLRVLKTRQNIKSSLLELMDEKPISAITITELSKKAMINRKTFYRHYGSVNDVVEDIELEILDTLVSLLNQSNSSCLKIGVVLKYIGTTIEINKATLSRMINQSPDFLFSGKLFEVLRKATEVSLRSIVKKEDGKMQILSQFVVSGALTVYFEWLKSSCSESVENVVETVRKLTYGSLMQFIPKEELNSIELY